MRSTTASTTQSGASFVSHTFEGASLSAMLKRVVDTMARNRIQSHELTRSSAVLLLDLARDVQTQPHSSLAASTATSPRFVCLVACVSSSPIEN